MDRDELRALVIRALDETAPGTGASALRGSELMQDALDLDSFDFLTFVQRLHDATGVDIPELDYPRVLTLDGVVAYLEAHAPVA